jgi:hypothetical protein
MRTTLGLSVLLYLLVGLSPAKALVLARDGQALATIIVAPNATTAEKTAATELADYLGKITAAKFTVKLESSAAAATSRLFVGHTQAAAKLGIEAGRLGPEEWIIRTAGEDLYLLGGRPRGTLYAVYHFLEDQLGVRWWTPWEETVPSAPTLQVGALNRRGQPGFRYRDMYMIYGQDEGRFAARNRLNREGDPAIASKYGGALNYGPPHHCHTFIHYFPPAKYFQQHPEWFSLIGGKRTDNRPQLCLTNPELRQAYLAKLREYIRTSWAAAKEQDLPPPLVFSVSQNDWLNACQCDKCQAIAKAEGSESGPLLDFVNYMADGVKDDYPEVFIDTLAYQYTQKAPKTIKARDNVIIRLCDTESDMLRPITHANNRAFQDHILSWASIAKNLRIWEYAVTYAYTWRLPRPSAHDGLPLPTAHTFGPDYRFFRAHNVEGVFVEHEYPVAADLRDFKVWIITKTLEDPDADYAKLRRTFLEGFYGAAGEFVGQYLSALEAEMEARGSRSTCWRSTASLSYLNLSFLTRAHELFDKAERAVQDDEVLLRRVHHARLPVDRATLVNFGVLASEWITQGHDIKQMPLDRDRIGRRALKTWKEQIALRLPEAQQERERLLVEGEIQRLCQLPAVIKLPEKFQDLPRGAFHDFTAIWTRNHLDWAKLIEDPEAESGIANRLLLADVPAASRARYALPMAWGLYGTMDKQYIPGTPIKAEDVPGAGYHWYKMGTYKVPQAYYAYFFWSWCIQVDVDRVYDPAQPDQKFDFWARIKFEGPMFPHGKATDKDAIYVERLVLAKAK